MKKKLLTVAVLCFSLMQKAKSQDSLYQKKLVSKTDIELIYSQYLQEGHNSAVTGGKGTENLKVFAPSLKISHNFKEYNTLNFIGGVDAITSASTDKIDYVMSSASRKDLRSYFNLNYDRQLKKKDITIGAGSGMSIESDYLSIPVFLAGQYTTPSKLSTFNFGTQAYFDDLRWGRLNEDYHRPVELVYPIELRDTAWFDIYRRTSLNFKFGWTQVVNRRLVAGIYPEFTYQKGLLSTPFHRVYFKDGPLRVENLPRERYKFPVSFKANYFLGSRTVLRFEYGFYWDSFGIQGNSAELEAAVKLTPGFVITPFARIYGQSAARYFNKYKQHSIAETYYTSDYDLSEFISYKAGMNLRFLPVHARSGAFGEANVRYSYYYRSNGLGSHIITLSMKFHREKYRPAGGKKR